MPFPHDYTNLIVLLAVMHALMCVRVALFMRRGGYNPFAWFFISLFGTALIAHLYLRRKQAAASQDQQGPLEAHPAARLAENAPAAAAAASEAAPPPVPSATDPVPPKDIVPGPAAPSVGDSPRPIRRCPHCGRIISPAEPAPVSPPATCPHCHLPLDEVPQA